MVDYIHPATPEQFLDAVAAKAYDDNLRRCLSSMRIPPAEQDDILQKTYTKMFFGFGKYDPGRPITALLATMARNAGIDYLRRDKHAISLDELTSDPLVEPDDLEKRDLLQKLTPIVREEASQEFLLRLAGASDGQIAAHLRVPLGTVKTRLRRSRLRIVEEFQRRYAAAPVAGTGNL